jgi:hypothetical protein
VIIAVASSRSRLWRNTAFQPAWKTAVDKTSATIHGLKMRPLAGEAKRAMIAELSPRHRREFR